MTYEDLIPYLQQRHFYPAKVTAMRKTSNVTVGLHVDSPPILKQDRMEAIRKILPEGFDVKWVGNDKNYILIEKSKV